MEGVGGGGVGGGVEREDVNLFWRYRNWNLPSSDHLTKVHSLIKVCSTSFGV